MSDLVKHNGNNMQRISSYMRSADVRERFEEMVGAGSARYLNQVLAVVASSDKLQECTPASIFISAVRAASLRLSVDPAQGQAWIVPYKDQATFQIGYKGIYALAMRTGKYRFAPHAFELYEGETFIVDRMTGLHKLGGARTGSKVIGYGAAFTLFTGTSATYYMTVEEIDAHAEHYSPAYHWKSSPWNDPMERPKMRKKTLFSAFMRQSGVFEEADKEKLIEIEESTEWHDLEGIPEDEELREPQPVAEAMASLYPEPAEEPKEEPKEEAPAARPYQPAYLQSYMAKKIVERKGQPSDSQRKLLTALLSTTANGDNNVRHAIMKFLTGKLSSKDFTDAETLSLLDWLAPEKTDAGYIPCDEALKETAMIIKQVFVDQGQASMNLAGAE